MNILAKATESLRNGWCRDTFREDLPEGEQFCSMGALATAYMGTTNFIADSGDVKDAYFDSWNRLLNRPEITALDEVIKQQYPDERWEEGNTGIGRAGNVIRFNDQVAKSADEVIAIFEKATAKMDES